MEQSLIYTDLCNKQLEERIVTELKRDIVLRFPDETWNVNDALSIITDPRLELAVINIIDEITIMEIALLHMLCKPILLTARAASEYKVLTRTVDYLELGANLKHPSSTFIKWYKLWKGLE